MADTSRSSVSLFDQELSDLLMGVRIIGKDIGSGDSDKKQEQVTEQTRDRKNGNLIF